MKPSYYYAILVTHESEVAEYAKRTIFVRDGMIQSPSASSKGASE
jgi:putative ABC transport system ATP-binding protein